MNCKSTRTLRRIVRGALSSSYKRPVPDGLSEDEALCQRITNHAWFLFRVRLSQKQAKRILAVARR